MSLGGFSIRRLTGVSAFKFRLSRRVGIPFTKSGRQRKLGALHSSSDCSGSEYGQRRVYGRNRQGRDGTDEQGCDRSSEGGRRSHRLGSRWV
jgi:hypothetical protein